MRSSRRFPTRIRTSSCSSAPVSTSPSRASTTRRATGWRSSTASGRRARRPWSAVASAPARSTSGWRRCLFADQGLLASRLAVRDAGGGDAGAQKGQARREQHPGPEAVDGRIPELPGLLILRQGHGVATVDLCVEDERDDEPDDGDGDQAPQTGDGRVHSRRDARVALGRGLEGGRCDGRDEDREAEGEDREAGDSRCPEVRALVDEEEEERADAEQQRAEGEVEAGAPPGGERPEAGGEEDHDEARRDIDQAGFERAEAEELEVDGEEDEEAVERGVDEERLQVGDGEVPTPEELEWEHRLAHAALDGRECGKGGDGGDEGPPVAGETAPRAFHEPVGERAEAHGREGRARKVEAPDAHLHRLVTAAETREHDSERGEREVDEEDPAPGDPFDERTADGRACDRGDTREGGPESDRASRLIAVDPSQEGERVRRQESAG